jgi:hypothetical protein
MADNRPPTSEDFAPSKTEEAAPTPPLSRVPVIAGAYGIQLQSLDEMVRLANMLVIAGVAPRDMKPGGVVAILQAGAELGMKYMWSLAHLTFVNGRLGIDGTASMALVRSSGVCRPEGQPTLTMEGEPFTDEWTATYTAHRRDRAMPVSASFSFKDAQRMGLLKVDPENRQLFGRGRGNTWSQDAAWATATPDMMAWRAWARLSKREFPDVILGLALTDELRDTSLNEEVAAAAAREVGKAPARKTTEGPDPLLAGLDAVEDVQVSPAAAGEGGDS